MKTKFLLGMLWGREEISFHFRTQGVIKYFNSGITELSIFPYGARLPRNILMFKFYYLNLSCIGEIIYILNLFIICCNFLVCHATSIYFHLFIVKADSGGL